MNIPNDHSYPRAYSGYTLLESIGQGGMSAIDLAQTTVTDAQYVRFVVIKRMHAHLGETDDSYIRMFQDEARISAELQHANIAQVYNFGQYDNEFFMVMEYVPGLDLRELQKDLANQNKGIPIRITLKILYDILQALDYAHHRVDTYGQSLNIVHRDVNPRNVMLSIRGEVKLIDFGVAKADNRMDQTVGHTIKGKFAYMAPEQIDPGVGTVDGRADLFAVGLMLFEMVAGRRPFLGLNEIQIMHKIMSVDLPDLPRAPDHPEPELLQTIFNRVTTKSPNDRYTSAGDMARAIHEASTVCGGMANSSELAQFLKDNMPTRIDAIAARLSQYKTHATLNTQTEIPIPPVPYMDTTNPTAATTLKREPPTRMVEETTVEMGKSVQYGWMALGGLLLFGIGFGIIAQFKSPTKPTLSPTQVISEPVEKPNPTVPPPAQQDLANELDDEKDDLQATTVTPPTPSTTVSKKSQTQATRVTKTTKSSSSNKIASKSSTEAKTNKRLSSNDDKSTATKTTTKDVPTTQNKVSAVSPSTKQQTPTPGQAKEVPSEPVVMHTFYLMVGVDSGTRGLPVLYKGREITKTGAKKSVTLPVGNIKIEIQDPKTGSSVYQSITVHEGDPILTVQVRRM